MTNISSLLQKTGFWILFIVVTLTPLFFLPLTSEFYEFNKQALLSLSALLLLIIWTAIFVIERRVSVLRSPFGLPLFLLAVVWVISTFYKTPNRFDAFLQPGNTSTILGLVILFFSGINLTRSRRELEILFYGFLASSFTLSLLSLLWSSNLTGQLIPIPFLKSVLWTPTGNALSTFTIHLTTTLLLILLILKEKANSAKTLALGFCLFLSLLSSAAVGFRLFMDNPANRPLFLPQSAGWVIALEALKTSPLFGTGPATFLSDFTQFRPLSLNLSPTGSVRFPASSSQYLHVLTLTGILGLATYLFLVARVFIIIFKLLKTQSESPLRHFTLAALTCVGALFISQIFVVSSYSTLFFLFTLLILATLALKHLGSSLIHEANIDIVASTETGIHSPLLPAICFTLAISLSLPSLYLGSRGYYAEVIFYQALQAASANNAKATYDLLLSAIRTNPYVDTYRIAFSQATFLIANNMASNVPPAGLTESDRNTITQLIQQSVQEAKNAVSLNPQKVTNVENLASIYRNLLSIAQGADAWTLASYLQAIRLDPTNPNLRISLGGLYFANKNYDEAVRHFQAAVDLKPNLANAHYNLSAAYREKGQFAQSYAAMQSVLANLDKNSPDYPKAQAEAEELRKKAGQAEIPTPAGPQNPELTAPHPLPPPKLTPPPQLPSELGPDSPPAPSPATSLSPTPIP